MKKREFQKFASEFLIPQLPGFAVKGHLIYEVPVGNLFRGFVFDSSGFSAKTFNPDAFVQPLYIPHDYITMTLGKRLLGVWEFQSGGDQALADRLLQSMRMEGLPLLQALGTPEKIAHDAEKLFSPKNHYVRQARAYSLVLIGQDREAIQRLDELLAMLKEMSVGIQKWALKVHAEVASFRETLLRDAEEARGLLAQWTEQTRQKLGLIV